MEGVEASFFGIDEQLIRLGRDGMNNDLIKTVQEQKPDLLFCFLFTEELKKETIDFITKKTSTKTFNWFGDDHWRFPVYSRFWAPLFTAVSTTDARAFTDYRNSGILNVIKTQWAANPFLYKPQDPAKNPGNYDITFYGQKYGNRGMYIKALQDAGLPAQGYGWGWQWGGGTDVQKMLDLYSYSKISLNFSETPYYGLKKKLNLFAKLFVKKELGKYSLNIQNFFDNYRATIGTQRRTIKSRVFDVSACGGFVMTGISDDDLNEYYRIDKEMVVFKNEQDLVAKGKYYLEHDQERLAIAKAGYQRTIKEHTYPHRFKEIFKFLGF